MIKKFNEHMDINVFPVDKKYIESKCQEFDIQHYTINDNGTVDVDYHVYMSRRGISKIPLKFNYVSGAFRCNDNTLVNLEGSPEVVVRDFYCYGNNLLSLKGCPKIIGGDANCAQNKLLSLKGGPEDVGGDFSCARNILESLEGCPMEISGNFNVSNNRLWDITHFPEYVDSFECSGNPISEILNHFDSSFKVSLCKAWPRFNPVYLKDDKWFVSKIDLENMFFDVSGRKMDFSRVKFKNYAVEGNIERLFGGI